MNMGEAAPPSGRKPPHWTTWFFGEMKEMFLLGWPQVVSSALEYFVQIVPIIFSGRLGTLELASVSLGSSLVNLISYAFSRGSAMALDTFASQTYGTTNKLKVGEHLQRGILVATLMQLLCMALLLNISPMLLLLNQPPEVVELCQFYLDWRQWALPIYAWYFILTRYIKNQKVVYPSMVVSLLGCGIALAFNFLFVSFLQYGVWGAALALNLTYLFMLIMVTGYIRVSGLYKTTWGGWSVDCLRDWGPCVRLVIFSAVLISLFWWSFQYGTFVAGTLGAKELATQSVMFQIEGVSYMISYGFGSGCQTRIGIKLGAKKPQDAIRIVKAGMLLQALVALIIAFGVWALGRYIMMLFSTDNDVIEMGVHIMPFVSVFLFAELSLALIFGVIRGLGRQLVGSLLLVVGLYAVGLSVSMSLAFLTNLRLVGIWIGYDVGFAVQNLVFFLFVARVDWNKEADKAQIRAGMTNAQSGSDGRKNETKRSSQDENSGLLQNNMLNNGGLTTRQVICRRSLVLAVTLAIFIAAFIGSILYKSESIKQTIASSVNNHTFIFESAVNL